MSLFGIEKDGIIYRKTKQMNLGVKKCTKTGEIIIPQFVNGQIVSEIEENAFENANVNSVCSSVAVIGNSAFENSKLVSIKFSAAIIAGKRMLFEHMIIGDRAFFNCKFLKNVQIDSEVEVEYLSDSAFSNCTSLENIDVSKFKNIGSRAFALCTSLSKIRLSKKLKGILPYTFEGCIGLKTVILPDELSFLSAHAFENCTNLTTVVLSKNLNSIGGIGRILHVLNGFVATQTSDFEIGRNPFGGCKSLKRLFYHGTKNEIDSNVEKYFTEKNNLKIYYFDENEHSVGTWYYNNRGIVQYYRYSDDY